MIFARLMSLTLAGLIVCWSRPASTWVGTTVDYHVPVLAYHRISCAPSGVPYPRLWVCPDRFDATLAPLKRDGWHSMRASEYSSLVEFGRPVPAKSLAPS